MTLGRWVGFLALILSIYILWRLRTVLLIAFAALVLATVINRLVKLLQRWVRYRSLAVAIAMLGLLLLLVGFVWIVVPPFIEQVEDLIELLPTAIARIETWFEGMEERLPGGIEGYLPSTDAVFARLQPWATRLFGTFFGFFANLLNLLGSILLVLVLMTMFLANPQLYRHLLIQLFPSFYRRRACEILDQSETALVNWAIGILIDTVFIGLVSAIGLWILQIPLVLANSFIAGFLETIPNLGPTLSVIPPTLVALTIDPWRALGVVILYIVIQQVEGYVLVPFVMRKTVFLPPAITLLSQIAFATFFSLLALFLSLPFVVIAQVWLQEVLVKDILNDWERSPTSKSTPTPPSP
ncbi:MAG: AI-2E family transporter [Chloroflexaceae bacterium]|nr:AI-2E family transporter [Chloroflexaceae bacterium]